VLEVRFIRVRQDGVARLRQWMAELAERSDEVRETFRREGVRHERAFLLDHGGEALLVYAMESDDPERARAAFAQSTLPIDLEHKRVIEDVSAGAAPAEALADLRLDPDGR
jgi:hypothetical protein